MPDELPVILRAFCRKLRGRFRMASGTLGETQPLASAPKGLVGGTQRRRQGAISTVKGGDEDEEDQGSRDDEDRTDRVHETIHLGLVHWSSRYRSGLFHIV